MPDSRPEWKEVLEGFRQYLADRGMKFTKPRARILKALLETDGHVSADELCQAIHRDSPEIGLATVHRTLRLLVEGGYAEEHRFDGRRRRFERSLSKHHHDHLICSRCKKIVEFEEPRIEALQVEVAQRFGFKITDHRLDLFGICSDCQARPAAE